MAASLLVSFIFFICDTRSSGSLHSWWLLRFNVPTLTPIAVSCFLSFSSLLSFQAVLKNGVISGSGFMNSGNVRCGSSVCRPISGVFAKNPLPNGYVHVTTIPAGASNITITELRNSINFLGKLSKRDGCSLGLVKISPFIESTKNYEARMRFELAVTLSVDESSEMFVGKLFDREGSRYSYLWYDMRSKFADDP